MAGIPNSQLLDLQKTTLANLPELEFETALDYQNYPVCNTWFRSDKVQVESGIKIVRNIILDTSGNAKHVRLYQKTPINVSDVQNQLEAPWCQAQTHYSIERREQLRNRSKARYVNLLQGRRVDATLDLANLLEERAWLTPSSATDDLNPQGLPYWISMLDDDTSEAGFNGKTIRYAGGTSATIKGGLDGALARNAKWRNYAALYTSINAAFVKAMRFAFHATRFQSPIIVRDLKEGASADFRIYMALAELCAYEDLVTQANDNIGSDLDPFHGATTFKRVPIIYTPVLDNFSVLGGGGTANSPAPVFGVNHSKFYPIVQDGDWMREGEPMNDVEQHNVFTTFIDCSYQYFCKNVREAGFVLHKNIAA